MKTWAVRFAPGADIKLGLQNLVIQEAMRAGVILTGVGSLTTVNLRYANASSATLRQGFFEIVSLVGTLSPDGLHVHVCVTGEDGLAFGGHLLDGCVVYTTAELVVAELPNWTFARTPDPATGFRELTVTPRL